MKVYFIFVQYWCVCMHVCVRACVQLYVFRSCMKAGHDTVLALVQYLARTEDVVCPTSEKLHLLQQHICNTQVVCTYVCMPSNLLRVFEAICCCVPWLFAQIL